MVGERYSAREKRAICGIDGVDIDQYRAYPCTQVEEMIEKTSIERASQEAQGVYRAMAMPSQRGLDGGVCA